MDWTGQCYGLPATPTTDILSKALDSSSNVLIFQTFDDFPFPQVCLSLSVISLVISEGLNHFSRKAHKRPTTMREINKVFKNFENIAYTSFRFKVFNKYIVSTSSRFKDA